jgi:GNAT superfamily N-acetyltransferase
MIREATDFDVPTCLQLGLEFQQTSEFGELTPNINKMLGFGYHAAQADDYCFFVSENKGKIDGFLIGSVCEYVFGHDLLAEEHLMYVLPEHRNGTTGVRLMRAFEQWGTEKGAKALSFSPNAFGPDPRWHSFTKRLGYDHSGFMYRKYL